MLVFPIDLEESASHPLPLPEGVPQVTRKLSSLAQAEE